MSKLFHLGQYTRHDRNIWYGPFGVIVSEPRIIARLEAEYRAFQSHQGAGPRPPLGLPRPFDRTPPVRQKGRTSSREKRANGRTEE